MSTGSTNPENETQAAPAPSATTITVAGSDYELAKMPVKDGLEIYGKLPADYQRMADAYGTLAQRFQRKIDVKLPGDMSFNTAWKNTIATLNKDGNLDKAEQYQKDIYAEFREQIDAVAYVGGAARTAEGAAGLLATGGAFASGGFDGLAAIPRFVIRGGSVVVGEVKDGVEAALTPISDDQARAFGSAMAGAALHENVERKNMSTASSIWNYPLQHAGAALDYATINIPGLNAIWPYLQACAQMVQQWLSVEDPAKQKDFSQFVEENKQAAEKLRSEGKANYSDLFEARVREGETSNAMQKMRAAEEVAGIQTDPLMDMAQHGGAFVDKDGNGTSLKPDEGDGPTPDPTVDMGENATRGSRILGALTAPIKEISEGLQGDHGVAYGAGLALIAAPGVAKVSQGAAQGAAKQLLQGVDNEAVKKSGNVGHALGRLADGAEKPLKLRNPFNLAQITGRAFGGMSAWMGEKIFGVTKATGMALGAAPDKLADVMQGSLHGAGKAIDAAEVVEKPASKWGSLGSAIGKWGTRLNYFSLGIAPVETISSVANNDIAGSAVYGSETLALGAGVAKLGLKRALPSIAPVASGADLTVGFVHGDERKKRKAGVELLTMGGGAAAGAGLGLLGGPFAPITVPGGAVAGLALGGLASIVTGWYADSKFVATPTATASGDGALGKADEGLKEAATVKPQTKQAQSQALAMSGKLNILWGPQMALANFEEASAKPLAKPKTLVSEQRRNA